MKRPSNWVQCLATGAVMSAAVVCLAGLLTVPSLSRVLIGTYGQGSLAVERVSWAWPGRLRLEGLRSGGASARAGFSVQEAFVGLEGIDWQRRSVKLGIRLNSPSLRVTRLKNDGVEMPFAGAAGGDSREGSGGLFKDTAADRWDVVVERIEIADAAVDFIDEHTAPAFRGMLQHFYAVLSAVEDDPGAAPVLTFAGRGEVLGYMGHAAPLQCSGWGVPGGETLEGTCHLQALTLTAFKPYFVTFGRFDIREYDAALELTADWRQRESFKDRRLQLVLHDVRQGDISFRGRTVVDFKELTKGEKPVFEGELSVDNTPRAEGGRIPALFTPSNAVAQKLVNRFLEHNRTSLDLRCFGMPLRVKLTTASEAMMADIQESSREIQEALSLLSLPDRIDLTAQQSAAPITPPAVPAPEIPGAPATLLKNGNGAVSLIGEPLMQSPLGEAVPPPAKPR